MSTYSSKTLRHYYLQPASNNYLAHYGVMGMHWGVRRYQPYPKGYSGDGKFVGEIKKGAYGVKGWGPYQSRRAIRAATNIQRQINWGKRNEQLRKLKADRNDGKITSAEYKAKKRELTDQTKLANAVTNTKTWKQQVLRDAPVKTVSSVRRQFEKKAASEHANNSVRRGFNIANRILDALGQAGNVIAVVKTVAPTVPAIVAAMAANPAVGGALLATVIGGTATGAVIAGKITRLDSNIRRAIVNRFV